MGILIASSSQVVYGEVIWDPIEHLARFLDGSPSHAERFGVAIIAICFVYVQLILNLSANSIGAGCDMTALCESRGGLHGSVARALIKHVARLQ